VLIFGYDEGRKAFQARNSWGAEWCQEGSFWFPYAAAADRNLLWDAWMQHLGKPW
jgi:C1A family cysteine protease